MSLSLSSLSSNLRHDVINVSASQIRVISQEVSHSSTLLAVMIDGRLCELQRYRMDVQGLANATFLKRKNTEYFFM